MTSAVFLQVRLDSTRLPGKALLPLEDKTVIEHAMLSLRRLPCDHFVMLTAEGDEGELAPYAASCGFELFAGDRQDVLERFIQAGRRYAPDTIIRATGDNPLVVWEAAQDVLEYIRKDRSLDYAAMKGLPYGGGVELFRREALEQAYASTGEPYDHEHVTPYIYNNPRRFRLAYLNHKPEMSHRITLDTQEDYLRLQRIFKTLYHGRPIDFRDLKEYLQNND